MKQSVGVVVFTIASAVLGMPAASYAQGSGAATIAGVVRDTSQAALPGVTVEATSPALTGTARTAVTDGNGAYRIEELRPGTYTVTYTLPGFSITRRDGLELSPSFTATVDIELSLGSIEETITVSGRTPLVDTQNVTQQRVISRELLAAVPTSQSMLGIASLMPAVVQPPNAQDVGGSMGERSIRISIHGARTTDARLRQEGMIYNGMTPGTNYGSDGLEGAGRGYYVNPLAVNEILIDAGTMGSAEYGLGGAQSNALYRDGGNRLSGAAFGAYTGSGMQWDNLSQELFDQGLQNVNTIRKIYDANFTVGGPIVKNRVFFFAHTRGWGVTGRPANLYRDANVGLRVPGAPIAVWSYAPDLNAPVDQREFNKALGVRFAAQVTKKDRVTFSYDRQRNFQDSLSGALNRGATKLEANGAQCLQNPVAQATWLRPQSNSVLFEAGFTTSKQTSGGWGMELDQSDYEACGFQLVDNVLINDTGLGYTYNGGGIRDIRKSHQANGRFSTSWVQAAHSLKTGAQFMYGLGGGYRTYSTRNLTQIGGLPLSYQFNNGTPTQLTQFAAPIAQMAQLSPDLGVFVQDQWRMAKGLTASLGLRFDWVRAYAPALCQEGGPLVDARCFDERKDLPNWKDLSPRMGVVWDPTGSGLTAIKIGLNRYVNATAVGLANQLSPVNAAVASTTRSWNDGNLNRIPDCDLRATTASGECGPMANANFGRTVPAATPDPDWVTGWGKRGYNWQLALAVDRQLTEGLSVTAGYYRTWYGNQIVVDNVLVGPQDYDPYCVTVPVDTRLQKSGQQICGLYDLNPTKVGLVDQRVTLAKNFGTPHDVYNGADVVFQYRRGSLTAGGGWNIGNSIQTGVAAGGNVSNSNESCFVVDTPQDLFNCKVNNPYQSRIKLNGAWKIPWQDIQLAVVYQNNPGPGYTTNITYSNAQIAPTLGRPLSVGSTRTIQVAEPNSLFGPRIPQLDLRASKFVRLPGGRRVQLNADIYNVANSNHVIDYFFTYNLADRGATWKRPVQVFDGRLAKFSVQFDF
jgi:hypothetical protein